MKKESALIMNDHPVYTFKKVNNIIGQTNVTDEDMQKYVNMQDTYIVPLRI